MHWTNKEEFNRAVDEYLGLADLQHAFTELQTDKDIIIAAIKRDRTGQAFRFAAPALQADKDVAMPAVRLDGENLRWCAPVMQDDPQVVYAAVCPDRTAQKYASERLRNLSIEELRTLAEEQERSSFVADAKTAVSGPMASEQLYTPAPQDMSQQRNQDGPEIQV